MVLKKWFFLLLSAWLINTMVCFQGSDLFENHLASPTHPSIHHNPQNLLLWLARYAKPVSDGSLKQPLKIKYRYRYLGVQHQMQQVFWKIADKIDWPADGIPVIVRTFVSSSKTILFSQLQSIPLFRLTPF